MTLAVAFAGWSSEKATALLTVLPADARTGLRPHPNILTVRLAHPDRQDTFRQALNALDALPASVTLPTLHALDDLTHVSTSSARWQLGACLVRALRE